MRLSRWRAASRSDARVVWGSWLASSRMQDGLCHAKACPCLPKQKSAISRWLISNIAMDTPMRWNDRIGRRIKLSDLHILLAVAQSGSMARAASHLSISQPVVSRAINELEHTLGVRLLERSRRGIELTPYGRTMLNCGQAVFDDLRQGVEHIEFLADPMAGEVRIGSTTPLLASFVSTVIERMHRRYPRMMFSVVTTNADALLRDLDQRNLDLLFW